MNELRTFYQKRADEQQAKLKRFESKLLTSSLIRGLVFIATGLICYYSYPSTTPILIGLAIGIALFLFLISRHTDLKHLKSKAKALLSINERELEILDRNFSSLESGDEFVRTDTTLPWI